MDVAHSVHSIPIRLTEERWEHIAAEHPELAGCREDVLAAVGSPDAVVRGYGGTLIAVVGYGRGRYLCVVYREIDEDDGFIITAYFSDRYHRRKKIWPQP